MKNTKSVAFDKSLTRRNLLLSAPMAGIAIGAPKDVESAEISSILSIIEELEALKGWEASNVVASKAYTAFRLRRALGEICEPSQLVKDHVGYQADQYGRYKLTLSYERDIANGKRIIAPVTLPS